MADFGRILVGIGIAVALVGLVIILGSTLGLGSLPGDIVIRKDRYSFYFPFVTSILVSVVLTIFLNVIARWRR